MDICQKLEADISKQENERNIRCTHPNSDKQICVEINYNLWLLNIQYNNLCQNKTKIIKNTS